MTNLPVGYIAVESGYDKEIHTSFKFKGVEYSVIDGVNIFSSLHEAANFAEVIPQTVLDGLDYSEFSTPVILFSQGKHVIDNFTFKKSLTLLGQGASVNPNIFSEDKVTPPVLNEQRRENESVLLGSYWRGNVHANDENAEIIIFDGFSSDYMRFRDVRKDGKSAYVSFRNIIHISPCGNTLYLFSPANPSGTLNRHVDFKNIRVHDYDDLDYGGNFTLMNAKKVTIDGISYDTTQQIFGFTNMARTHSNCATNFPKTEIEIKNSYFRNLQGEHGISTACSNTTSCGIDFLIKNSVFVDANRENEAVIQPQMNENCTLTVDSCKFIDSRSNKNSAIYIKGQNPRINIENSEFIGFSREFSVAEELSQVDVPFIFNTDDGFTTQTTDPHFIIGKGESDYTVIDELYSGTKAYYGDLHAHTSCGGTSDGSLPMAQWPARMDEKQLDFAAIVDHRQMRGFFLPEWDEEKFIIGTEPGTAFLDLNACRHNQREVHYNMLFPHKYGLAMVLANFPEFKFHGDELTGTYSYPKFMKERFYELTNYVHSIGGIMVHPHPKTMLSSDDPLDYYFGEHTYIETLYGAFHTHASIKNYNLWVQLLALGKRVYTSGGSDTHGNVNNDVVSTFYTREKNGLAFFNKMKTGDFTVGMVGMKMCIDESPMGSEIPYREGSVLNLILDDYYTPHWKNHAVYELRIMTDKGLAYSSVFNGTQKQEISLKVQKRMFYRAEVYDLTHDYLVAVGNPIWLD